MQDRQQHQQQVRSFLQKHFSSRHWEFDLPIGTGNETYFARDQERTCFIKLGVQTARYQDMAALGLTPPVLAAGCLEDGTPILVQPCVPGRIPTRKDYRLHIDQFATTIDSMHHSAALQQALPAAPSDLYQAAGMKSLERIRGKWELYRARAPEMAGFVDESLALLDKQVRNLAGAGLVASHNDICNANWLVTPDGQLYLTDLESMSMDDPALDIGATLWWYYPPELRRRFLEIVGYADDEGFGDRMRVRMAMHCLDITLPRPGSFDRFDPAVFAEWLVDFKAALVGEENPEGFED